MNIPLPGSFFLSLPIMKIIIDNAAGFCPGVQHAINLAEEELQDVGSLYSLGSLLHNEMEMGRLRNMGLIDIGDLNELADSGVKKVLIRAHGEPPETYKKAASMGIELIDASCGVVKRLQQKVKRAADEMELKKGQVVIFGKPGHPEVTGLLGQTAGEGILVSSLQDLGKLDMARPVRLFSQTTMDGRSFELLEEAIENQMRKKNANPDFTSSNTICRYVSRRIPAMKEFALQSEVIIFVSGRESSNGKKLYKICKEVNPRTYFISETGEIERNWFSNVSTVGITGAASTPQWLMEELAEKIRKIQ